LTTSGERGETITAISTPLGAGGIGIVRISGPRSLAIAKRLFRLKGGARFAPLSRRFYTGEILHPDDGRVLDEVLLVYMAAPKTYTREDVVEIQGHSGILVLKEILKAVLCCGARLAEPGEFTKRAFLNGRLDLAQAEAVIDLIRAKTSRSLKIAHEQRAGRLSREVRAFQDEILELLTLLEAAIDFPEEGLPELSREELHRRLETAQGGLDALLRTYEEGKLYREGLSVVIAGRPNVGKSSLLNALLREERAIVTASPGTTRDVIEETLNISGIPLRIMDTAGLRRAGDAIEEEGVKRTKDRVSRADLVIWVVDGSEPLRAEDRDILPLLEPGKTLIALNKNDLPPGFPPESLRERIPRAPLVSISALRESGIENLKDEIRGMILGGKTEPAGEVLLSNLRHKQALERARRSLHQALESLAAGLAEEFLSADLKEAQAALGEIVGTHTPEDILERIFSQFCVGK
jgi:tRNA modification GTPase